MNLLANCPPGWPPGHVPGFIFYLSGARPPQPVYIKPSDNGPGTNIIGFDGQIQSDLARDGPITFCPADYTEEESIRARALIDSYTAQSEDPKIPDATPGSVRCNKEVHTAKDTKTPEAKRARIEYFTQPECTYKPVRPAQSLEVHNAKNCADLHFLSPKALYKLFVGCFPRGKDIMHVSQLGTDIRRLGYTLMFNKLLYYIQLSGLSYIDEKKPGFQFVKK